MTLEGILFAIFTTVAISGGLLVVLARDPIRGALSLVASFFGLACLYVLQRAELLGVLEVLVYAGAIMVLFVFVIMLVEKHDEPILPKNLRRRLVAPIKMIAVLLIVVNLALVVVPSSNFSGATLTADFGTTRAIGLRFARDFVFQFELVSVLLLVAIVGAVILAKRDVPPKSDASSEPPAAHP